MKTSVKEKYLKKARKLFGKGLLKKFLKKKAKEKAANEDAEKGLAASVSAASSSGGASPSAASSSGGAIVPLPPLPPPPFEAEAEGVGVEGLKIGDKVRIWSDKYGRAWTGVECVVKSFAGGSALEVETEALRRNIVQHEDLELTNGLKPLSDLKNLRQVTATLREMWLVETGFGDAVRLDEDSFKTLSAELKSEGPMWLRTEQLNFCWRFTSWALQAPPSVAYLDPLLTWMWYHHDGIGEEADDDQKKKWQMILKTVCRKEVELVLIPLAVNEHWSLLVLESSLQSVKYYDSLLHESEAGYLAADILLTKLRHDGLEHMQWLPLSCPHRCHAATQGPLECGFFVGWWMEEEVRQLMGEGRWRRGWVIAKEARVQMLKIMNNCVPAANKMQAELLKLADMEGKEIAYMNEQQAIKDSLAVVAALEKKSSEGAKVDLAAGFKGEGLEVAIHVGEQTVEAWAEEVWNLLLPSHQEDVKRVKDTGIGICSKCRWNSGCASCLWWKTVRYWRMKETKGKHMEAYGEAYRKQKLDVKKLGVVKGGGACEVV